MKPKMIRANFYIEVATNKELKKKGNQKKFGCQSASELVRKAIREMIEKTK